MAKHVTRKSTTHGKHTTIARRAARANKHMAPRPFDAARLQKELAR